jgi:glycosyltransferase involved in cell wall biosynthesis
MIITDSPLAGSGFGEEMRHIGFRLAQSGHEISFIGFSYAGRPIDIPDTMFSDVPHKGATIKLLGQYGDIRSNWGAEALARYYNIYNPDMVLIMGDPKHVAPYARLKKKLKFPLLFYVTLDGIPVLPQWGEILTVPDVNIAMTEWAMKEYMNAGIPFGGYIHHGVNWEWWQTNDVERAKLRKKYGISDDTTVFINWDTNQHRKRMDALLRCWKNFKPETKKAKLLLFTDFYCELGWNLDEKILQYGIDESTIIRPEQLIGREKVWGCSEEESLLREIACLGDIYISTTSGEGFGKCLLEAMAMGMTVIAPNYSAIPEVLGENGVLVPIKYLYQEPDRLRSVQSGVVDEEKFVDVMLYYYNNPEERKALGQKAKEWAREFDYDSKIMVGWLQMLSNINPDALLASQMLRT